MLFPFSKPVFASSIICQDNFSDLRTCVWTKIPSEQTVFTEETGVFVSRTKIDTPHGRYFLLTGNLFDSNYFFNFHIKGISGFHKKAVFRWQDQNNYYLLDLKSSIENDDSWIRLYSIKSGEEKLLASTKFINQVGNWYFVEIRAIDNHFLVYVFSKPLVDFTDNDPILSGSVGFAADSDNTETIVWYNHIIFTGLEENQNYPVIFIPGLGASWNVSAMLSCNLEPSSDWTLAPYADMYQRLIKTFTENAGYTLNKDFFVYTYDWRVSMEQAGKDFKLFLDNILATSSHTQFNIVSHSLGGLVVRSYLNQNPINHHLKKVITLGSPHQGTVLAYPIWQAGEFWIDNTMLKLAASYLVNHCRTPLKLSAKDIIHTITPSIKDLLPIFNFLKPKGETTFIEVTKLTEQNTWLLDNPFPSNLYGTQFITVSGNNNSTLDYLETEPASLTEKVFGLWTDGKPISNHTTPDGDGTILKSSSLVNAGVMEILANTNHAGLIGETKAIQTIFRYLGQPNITPAIYQPTPQISEIKLPTPGLGETIWKKYFLKIHH